MSTPQNVTNRYVSSLLTNGRTNDYVLDTLSSIPNQVSGRIIGHYYSARVIHPVSDNTASMGVGATPLAAVSHALELHGVTFR